MALEDLLLPLEERVFGELEGDRITLELSGEREDRRLFVGVRISVANFSLSSDAGFECICTGVSGKSGKRIVRPARPNEGEAGCLVRGGSGGGTYRTRGGSRGVDVQII